MFVVVIILLLLIFFATTHKKRGGGITPSNYFDTPLASPQLSSLDILQPPKSRFGSTDPYGYGSGHALFYKEPVIDAPPPVPLPRPLNILGITTTTGTSQQKLSEWLGDSAGIIENYDIKHFDRLNDGHSSLMYDLVVITGHGCVKEDYIVTESGDKIMPKQLIDMISRYLGGNERLPKSYWFFNCYSAYSICPNIQKYFREILPTTNIQLFCSETTIIRLTGLNTTNWLLDEPYMLNFGKPIDATTQLIVFNSLTDNPRKEDFDSYLGLVNYILLNTI